MFSSSVYVDLPGTIGGRGGGVQAKETPVLIQKTQKLIWKCVWLGDYGASGLRQLQRQLVKKIETGGFSHERETCLGYFV